MSRIASLEMKPGDRVIWLRSPGRSFVTGWRVQAVPGVIIRVCRHRLKLKVQVAGTDKLVIVHPENVICEEEPG